MGALDETHRQMLVVLGDLARLIDHLENDGVDVVARESARTICRFFNEHARQHHADEESLIFPDLLRKGDAELVQHVQRLQQDHGWLEEDWIELSPQLQAVSEGYSWYNLEELRSGVAVFTALYTDHIALEESMVYPEARRLAKS
jgi:hemerythrin-like domain-containing protein